MASITPVPFSLKAATVKMGADNYEAGITGFVLTPTTATSTVTAINGQTYSSAGATSWKAGITYVQDFETAASFANTLLASDGTPVEIQFTLTSGGKTFSVDVIPVPGDMGSAQAGTAMATVQLDCVSSPTVVVAP